MPWTDKDYPASMKNLTDEVRRKAIEIANALLDEGYEEGRSIAIATAQAEKWAKHRDKPIRKEDTAGDTGHAVAKGSDESDHAIHVIPDPNREGWIAQQDMKQLARGQDKDDVLNKARDKAKSRHTELCIHNEQGKVTNEEDYS